MNITSNCTLNGDRFEQLLLVRESDSIRELAALLGASQRYSNRSG